MAKYNTGDICPACSKGKLSEKIVAESFEYKGRLISFSAYPIFKCNTCPHSFLNTLVSDLTEKILINFRRLVDET